MPKNIIRCCDGTSDPLAVVRLYRCAPSIPGRQITLYDPGVGATPST